MAEQNVKQHHEEELKLLREQAPAGQVGERVPVRQVGEPSWQLREGMLVGKLLEEVFEQLLKKRSN